MSDNIKIIIPFRDRGLDPRRAANLEVVLAWWWAHGFTPEVVSDGHEGDTQFNRHRAYNRAVSGNPDADVFVFTEADMLIAPEQIIEAARFALKDRGLVVPFTEYRYLSDDTTALVRDLFYDASPETLAGVIKSGAVFKYNPESIRKNGRSIGAVNVVSRETLDITGGFTEATFGNWYDDNITAEGFAYLTGTATRWVDGPAVHLYHLPGWKGDHLTDEDRRATFRNKALLDGMRLNIQHGYTAGVRNLMKQRAQG